MNVLIADDHPLFRMGLSLGLQSEGFTVVAEAENGRVAVERCRQGGVDVALLDVRMPELDGVAACRKIRQMDDPPIVVMLTTFDEAAIVEAARSAGAQAYLSKETSPKDLARLLRRIVEEPERDLMPRVSLPSLTPREEAVLELMARGLSTKGIARELGIGPATVKQYLQAIFRKLDVRDRVSAVRRAGELGLV